MKKPRNNEMKDIKEEIRLLGVDDAPFEFEQEKTKLIGSVFRGGKFLEGIIIKDVEVDGFDVTDMIIEMAMDSKHRDQLRVILLDGITFAGFNVADLERINEETDLDVMAVSRREPDKIKLEKALENVSRREERRKVIEKAGEVKKYKSEKGVIYFQNKGLSEGKAREILKVSCTRSLIPEPIRVSHMMGSALKFGETRGRV